MSVLNFHIIFHRLIKAGISFAVNIVLMSDTTNKRQTLQEVKLEKLYINVSGIAFCTTSKIIVSVEAQVYEETLTFFILSLFENTTKQYKDPT